MNPRFEYSEYEMKTPSPGTLLVASPALRNTPFHRTVVLILQNNDQGIFGATLNRPADDDIRFAWKELTGTDIDDSLLVQGGPINGPVFAIHRERDLADSEIAGGVFVSAETEAFLELTQNVETDYRIVFGIAGWQIGQLESEIELGYWLPLQEKSDYVFQNPNGLWERSMRRYGRQMLTDVTGISAYPASAIDN